MNIFINSVNEVLVTAQIHQYGFQKNTTDCESQLEINTDKGGTIYVTFDNPEALIDFCKKHNFPLEDKRNAEKQ